MASGRSVCSNFTPNLFKKDKCQNCFHSKKEHLERSSSESKSLATLKEGFLTKAPDLSTKSAFSKKWKKRWFVLKSDGEMNYYEDEKSKKSLGTIRLSDCTEVTDAEADVRRFNCLALHTTGRVYYVEAETKEEIDAWFKAFAPFLSTTSQVKMEARKSFSREESRSGSFGTDRERAMTIRAKVDVKVMKGWLKKQGGSNKSFKDRWFVMDEGGKLSYFKDDKTATPQGIIDLLRCTGAREIDSKKGYEFEIMTADRVFVCCSDTLSARQNWIEAINGCVSALKRAEESAENTQKSFESAVEDLDEKTTSDKRVLPDVEVSPAATSEENQKVEAEQPSFQEEVDDLASGDELDNKTVELESTSRDDQFEALLEAEVSALTKQLKIAKEDLKAKQEKEAMREKENKDLKNKLLTAEAEQDELKRKLVELSKERDAVVVSSQEATDQLLSSQTSEWVAKEKRLEEDLRSANSKCEELEKLVGEREEEMGREREAVQSKIQETTFMYETKMEELKQLHENEVDELRKETESHKTKETSADERVVAMKKEHDETLMETVKTFEAKQEELVAHHERDISLMKAEWEKKLEEERDTWKKEIENLKEENAISVKKLESTLASAKASAAEESDSVVKNLRDRLEEIEKECDTLRETCKTEREKKCSAESALTELEKTKADVSAQLEIVEKAKTVLEAEIESMKKEREIQREELDAALEKSVVQSEKRSEELKRAEEELKKLKTDSTSLELEIERLKQALEEKSQLCQTLEDKASKVELDYISLKESYQRLEESRNVDDELKRQLSEVQKRLSDQEKDAEELRVKNLKWEKTVSAKDSEIAQLEAQLKESSTASGREIESLNEAYEESVVKRNELEDKVALLLRKMKELDDEKDQEIKAIKIRLEKEASSSSESVSKTVSEFQRDKANLEAKLAALETERDRERKTYQFKLKELTGASEESSQREVKLEKNLKETQIHRDSLLLQLRELEEAVAKAKKTPDKELETSARSTDSINTPVSVSPIVRANTVTATVSNMRRRSTASASLGEVKGLDNAKRTSFHEGLLRQSTVHEDHVGGLQPPPKPPKPDMRTRVASMKRTSSKSNVGAKSTLMKLFGLSTTN
ncbi:golgin subfamily A member 6-like protein 22 isoform X2 [Oscarella lobularis]|uniref:golgin subfamily A member 6-like protein 22 isoform X2 n=1 Tax=Oscarella lobularis TaxID=121494 RepID=UPI003314222B